MWYDKENSQEVGCMEKLENLAKKLNFFQKKESAADAPKLGVWGKIKKVIGFLVTWIYRLRGLILAAPVAFAAMWLANYNMKNLPDPVGINLQASGDFATTISVEMAVYGPLALTAACLAMMLCSRKIMYPWAISIFTLILPILLLFSNIYPA